MIDPNNPAGRLHTILTDALRKNEKEQTRKVWAGVFGVDVANETEIIRSLLSLQELVEEVHALIESNSRLNSELLLKSFPNLRRAVSAQNLSNPWSTYKAGLNPETITRLEFCPLSQNSCRLDRIRNYGAIRAERSGQIRTSIQGQGGGAIAAAGQRRPASRRYWRRRPWRK